MPEHHDHHQVPHWGPSPHLGHHYYAELNRVISVLFVGVLALMTFLLTVGFQRPHADFSWALYTTIIVLGLNLVAYVVGHLFYVQYMSAAPALEATPDDKEKDNDKDKDSDSDDDKEPKSSKGWGNARQRLVVVRVLQQILFVAAVIAVTWLALATAHFFFTIPATPTGGAAPTQ